MGRRGVYVQPYAVVALVGARHVPKMKQKLVTILLIKLIIIK